MTMSERARKTRRLSTRRDADWAARCCFAAAEDWVDGRVLNASMTGVAVRVEEGAASTGSVTVDLLPTPQTRLRLQGDIRHVQVVEGATVLGIEFPTLTPEESATLAGLLERYTSA